MYIFKYFGDKILRNEGQVIVEYADFITANPDFPITEGSYFEYGTRNDVNYFELIHNFNGTYTHANMPCQMVANVINAINALEE
jgi:hypothetical protein